MNIVKFFQDLADRWNADQKCGFCWSFSAPLSEDRMNATIKDEACCVHLFLTDMEDICDSKEGSASYLNSLEWFDVNFTIYAVQPTNLGINTYNEIPNHSTDESLWDTIIQPLRNCLSCGNEIDLCDLGYDFKIKKWRAKPILLHHDSNYTGLRINGTFRQYR